MSHRNFAEESLEESLDWSGVREAWVVDVGGVAKGVEEVLAGLVGEGTAALDAGDLDPSALDLADTAFLLPPFSAFISILLRFAGDSSAAAALLFGFFFLLNVPPAPLGPKLFPNCFIAFSKLLCACLTLSRLAYAEVVASCEEPGPELDGRFRFLPPLL